MARFPTDCLRGANQRLSTTIAQWENPGEPAAMQPETLLRLLDTLRQAAECLAQAPKVEFSDAEWERELSQYRANAQQLEKLLPEIQVRLLAEKARLEAARAHLSAAAAWAEGQKKTL